MCSQQPEPVSSVSSASWGQLGRHIRVAGPRLCVCRPAVACASSWVSAAWRRERRKLMLWLHLPQIRRFPGNLQGQRLRMPITFHPFIRLVFSHGRNYCIPRRVLGDFLLRVINKTKAGWYWAVSTPSHLPTLGHKTQFWCHRFLYHGRCCWWW